MNIYQIEVWGWVFFIFVILVVYKCFCCVFWVDEEFVYVFESIEVVCVILVENIDIEMVCFSEEQVRFVGDKGEVFEEVDLDIVVGDDLGKGQGGGFDVVLVFDDFEVWGD